MTRRGLATIDLAPGLRAVAPRAGLHLGAGTSGPVTLRLFRPAGTRVAAVSTLAPVQLLVLRAAGAGIAVRVLTNRPRQWQPLLAGASDATTLPPGSEVPAGPPATPSLLVDDRPEDARRLGDTTPWRCRIDLRTPATGGDLRTLTAADLLLVGGLLPDLALAATSGMGVSVPHLSQLTTPAAGTVSVLRRGGLDYVTLDPGPQEMAVLSQAS